MRTKESGVKERLFRRMEANKLDIFNFPRSPKNILWYLTHKYLYNTLGIFKLEIWDHLIKKYINDPRFVFLDTNEKKTSARGNITNQIWSTDESMSVNTFIKAAIIAGVKQVNMIVEWELEDRKIRGHLKFPLSDDVIVTGQDQKELDEKEKLIDKINTILSDPEKLETKEQILDILNKHGEV